MLDTIEENKVDCAIGGGRRDEEKARAKERFFSHRDDFGQWDPKTSTSRTMEHTKRESILKENILEPFLLVTGLKWMFGII